MYHFFDRVTNKRGDGLAKYRIRILDRATGQPVPIYSDESGTPIEAVSGVENAAVSDELGNYSLFVDDGTYDIEFRTPQEALSGVLPFVPMIGLATEFGALTPLAEDLAALGPVASDIAAIAPFADDIVAVSQTIATDVSEDAAQAAASAITATNASDIAAQAAEDVAGALEVANDLIVGENRFKQTTLTAAIAEGVAAVADGETFAASGDDVTYVGAYKRAGSSATEFWKLPKAVLPGATLSRFTSDRTITIADAVPAAGNPPSLVEFVTPAGMLGTITVPSNSADPLPIGTVVRMVQVGDTPVRFVTDGGAATITYLNATQTALVSKGKQAWLMKRGTDDWIAFGELEPLPAGVYSVKVWIDPSDLASMRQERTGAAATTPVAVGDPIGSIRNKGTLGGWAVARADVRRPTLRQDTTGRYYIETDGNATAANADFLELQGLSLNLAQLNLYVGFQQLSYQFADGIISLAPFDASGDVGNDRFAISQNALSAPIPTDFAFNMGAGGANRLSAGVAGVQPERPHLMEWRSTANNAVKTITVDGMEISNTGPTGLPALATTTALTTATVRLIIGANPGNEGQQGAIQHSNCAFYEIMLTDEVLTNTQRANIRAFAEAKTYPTPPVYPAFADLAAVITARQTLRTEIFGSTTLPTDLATLATDTSPPVTGLSNLASVQKMTIPGEADANIKPRLWTPNSPRSDVVAFIWAGHAAGITANGISAQALQPLLTAGVRVVTMVLPDGPNDFTSGSPTQHATNQTAFAKWFRQNTVAVNTLLNIAPGAKVIGTGISGGGWAAMMQGALDTRVTSTVQFVGSIPEFIYVNVDYEQWLTQISANYLQLYLMGSVGGSGNRRHIQVLHEGDEAGFNRAAYSSRPPYAEGMATRATALNGYFELRWFNYSLHALNADSTATLLAELP